MAKATAKQLRFAALVRVSTERQKKKGESCRTQTTFIEHCVKIHGGAVATWYQGQEHATPDQERAIFNGMLEDAQMARRPFDAVIVSHHSRWSRDNVDSKRGLAILRRCGVRLFVGMNEFDLNDYNARFVLGIQTEIAEREAAEKKWESVRNRMNRTRRGVPASGKLPFGRTFNPKTEKWGIDNNKRAMIRDVAKRYLKGESLAQLATEYGVNHANLHKTLTERCGTTWGVRFTVPDFQIDETFWLTVPELLDARTIEAVRAKVRANKTRRPGRAKYQYLLTGRVFCGHCGYAMSPQPQRGKFYYRHGKRDGAAKCPCRPRPLARCAELEEAVLRHVLDFYGNPEGIKRAAMEATPNLEKVNEFRERLARIQGQRDKITRARARHQRTLDDDLVPEEEVRAKLKELRDRDAAMQAEADRYQGEIDHLPTPSDIAEAAKRVSQYVQFKYGRLAGKKFRYSRHADVVRRLDAADPEKMPFEAKRELLDQVFNGTTIDGKPMGVYIEAIDGQPTHRYKRWQYKLLGNAAIDGHFGNTQLVTVYACRSPGTAPPARRFAPPPRPPAA